MRQCAHGLFTPSRQPGRNAAVAAPESPVNLRETHRRVRASWSEREKSRTMKIRHLVADFHGAHFSVIAVMVR
jgi:hypothetical protein